MSAEREVGVRGSCDAFAMNSRRARSSVASCSRMRSNARASSPSSSALESTTASSKKPPAIRFAARSDGGSAARDTREQEPDESGRQ